MSKITIEATILAAPKKVWEAWTEPKHIIKWNFAHESWQCPWAKNDLLVGGKYSARMEAKDGSFGFEFEAIYDEVVEQKKLTYTMGDGRVASTTFVDLGGKTKVTTVFDAEKENSEEMQKSGWQAILDNFKGYVEKSERELVVSRIISAPSNRVFEAWQNPELFKKWWVPKSAPIKLESCKMDVRTGGTYRLGFSMGEQSMEFFGRYLEVTPNSRLVWTNEEGGESAAVVTTVTFEETDGKTLVTVHDLYPSKAVLDEAIASESTGALVEQFGQLEELIIE